MYYKLEEDTGGGWDESKWRRRRRWFLVLYVGTLIQWLNSDKRKLPFCLQIWILLHNEKKKKERQGDAKTWNLFCKPKLWWPKGSSATPTDAVLQGLKHKFQLPNPCFSSRQNRESKRLLSKLPIRIRSIFLGRKSRLYYFSLLKKTWCITELRHGTPSYLRVFSVENIVK